MVHFLLDNSKLGYSPVLGTIPIPRSNYAIQHQYFDQKKHGQGALDIGFTLCTKLLALFHISPCFRYKYGYSDSVPFMFMADVIRLRLIGPFVHYVIGWILDTLPFLSRINVKFGRPFAFLLPVVPPLLLCRGIASINLPYPPPTTRTWIDSLAL